MSICHTGSHLKYDTKGKMYMVIEPIKNNCNLGNKINLISYYDLNMKASYIDLAQQNLVQRLAKAIHILKLFVIQLEKYKNAKLVKNLYNKIDCEKIKVIINEDIKVVYTHLVYREESDDSRF